MVKVVTAGRPNPEVKKAQLKELLTQYGSVEYIWFDHAVGDGGLSHKETFDWCKSFQPGCFIGFNHGDQEARISGSARWAVPVRWTTMPPPDRT